MTPALSCHRFALVLPLIALAQAGCPDPLKGKLPEPGQPQVVPRGDTRFVQVRNLLKEDPDSAVRARELYPLIEPVCTSEKERVDFVEVATWSAGFGSSEYYLPAELAQDTLDHVATACMRNHPEAAFDLLEKAQASLPKLHRLAVVQARLRAATGDLKGAEEASRRAVEAGSVHALALTANIQARRAREAGPGYREAMFEQAIQTVSATPTAKWPPIDLAAVLSTKARLLGERALWEPEAKAQRTRLEAAALHQRLAGAPFIAATRTRAQDVLCFEAIEAGRDTYAGCERLAETGDLGAALALGRADLDPARFDLSRLTKLQELKAQLQAMPKGQLVLLVVRGDELELLEWIRPASRLLAQIDEHQPRWVLVDRTDAPREQALIDRLLTLSGVKPSLRIEAKDTMTMPCVAAAVAGRQTPKSCPLEASTIKQLETLGPYGLSVLLGRDLDAEIDDLRLYELRVALVSFRQSRMDKGVFAWLKSLSDVGIITTPEKFGALGR